MNLLSFSNSLSSTYQTAPALSNICTPDPDDSVLLHHRMYKSHPFHLVYEKVWDKLTLPLVCLLSDISLVLTNRWTLGDHEKVHVSTWLKIYLAKPIKSVPYLSMRVKIGRGRGFVWTSFVAHFRNVVTETTDTYRNGVEMCAVFALVLVFSTLAAAVHRFGGGVLPDAHACVFDAFFLLLFGASFISLRSKRCRWILLQLCDIIQECLTCLETQKQTNLRTQKSLPGYYYLYLWVLTD